MPVRILINFVDWLFFTIFNQWGEFLLSLIGTHFYLIMLFLVLLIVLLIVLYLLDISKKKLKVLTLFFVIMFFSCVLLPFQAAYNTSILLDIGNEITATLNSYKIEKSKLPKNLNDLIPEYLDSNMLKVLSNNFKYRNLNDSMFVLEIHPWYLYSEFYRFYHSEQKFRKTDD